MNGKKHSSKTAAKSMPRLMKSIEFSRVRKCSAAEPTYRLFAVSVLRRM
jgi:hypothetical protein